jgi:hypothetical protein
MSYSFYKFDTPSTGVCCEYELFVEYTDLGDQGLTEFGFSSGENVYLKFSAVNGKLYDNDGNYVYSLGNQEDSIEIYGNIFYDYFNYSIDGIPVNTNCPKTPGVGIDSFFATTSGLNFSLRVNDKL